MTRDTKYVYEFPITVDLAETIPEVGELFNNLNGHLTTMGITERIGATAEITCCRLESSRELTDKELAMIRDEVRKCASESFAKHNVSVGAPRRQSGNVQQSVV